ncbi:MAG: ABC transporter ATP-binding protein [bacterium]
MSETPVLEFQDVTRAFVRGTPVLAGVTFAVRAGEVVALLGRNGSGKTTLVQIAMGMLFPHGGTVRAFGLVPTEHPVAVKRRIGYVAEDQVLPPGWSVPDLLAFHRRVFPSWDSALETELLERFGLAGVGTKIGQLSKGRARQVALVAAVCHRPELLILDEPAGGLDPAARREFLETSIQLLNREGTAILFSSHHMPDVERLGGRVVLLDDGKVRIDSDMDSLREAHCVAIIPTSAERDARRLEAIPGCLHVRRVRGEWRAVFQGDAASVRAQLGDAGVANAQCVSVPLEELFIELVGGERLAEAS